MKVCIHCRGENKTDGVYCHAIYCAKAVPTAIFRAKLARFGSRVERASEHVASALGCLREAVDVVKEEDVAGLGQLEVDVSVAYDIARAVERLIEHAESAIEDVRVAAGKPERRIETVSDLITGDQVWYAVRWQSIENIERCTNGTSKLRLDGGETLVWENTLKLPSTLAMSATGR